jgi:hypothetical protein
MLDPDPDEMNADPQPCNKSDKNLVLIQSVTYLFNLRFGIEAVLSGEDGGGGMIRHVRIILQTKED